MAEEVEVAEEVEAVPVEGVVAELARKAAEEEAVARAVGRRRLRTASWCPFASLPPSCRQLDKG